MVGIVAFGFIVGVGSCRAGEEEYLVSRGGKTELKQELILREEQGGFAGTCGRTWRIARDGRWTVVRFRDFDGEEKPIEKSRREGQLDAEQLVRLARRLSADKMTGLPAHIGPQPSINPHRYLLIYGNQKVIMDGVEPRREGTVADNIRDGSPALPAKEARERDRFAGIAGLIEECTVRSRGDG